MNLRHIIAISLIPLVFSSCDEPKAPNEKKEISENANQHKSTYFIQTFEGQLAEKYDILMKITSDEGKIKGMYKYKSVGADLQLSGSISEDGKIEMAEYDEKGNQTGVFKGKLVNNNKIDGEWSKPNGDSTMPFYLIASNTSYEAFQAKPKETQSSKEKDFFRIYPYIDDGTVYEDGAIDKYLKNSPKGVRGILAFYGTLHGSHCEHIEQSEGRYCDLTSLGLYPFDSEQCSQEHINFVKSWFKNEPKILEQSKYCYNVPEGAGSQSEFNYVELAISGDLVTVKWEVSVVRLQDDYSGESKGEDVYRVHNDYIEVVSVDWL